MSDYRNRRLSSWRFFFACVSATLLAIAGFGTAHAQSTAKANNSDQPSCTSSLAVETATIKRVSDGDTVQLSDGRRVRLIGINTPELEDPSPALQNAAKQARDSLQTLLPQGETVVLHVGRESQDRHRRLLAHVVRQSDGLPVAKYLLENGLATHSAVSPNTLCAENFENLERQARDDQQGIWKHSNTLITQAVSINKKSRGFKLISGTVSNVQQHSKHARLTLDNTFTVIVRNTISDTWNAAKKPDSLIGKTIEVRGWLSRSKKQVQLRLQHESNIEVVPH